MRCLGSVPDWHAACSTPGVDHILRYSLLSLAIVVCKSAHGNDLRDLYALALTRDNTLQVAHFQRDAAIEVRPQALASLLPQVAVNASATRERAGYEVDTIPNTQGADCCHGTVRGLGLNLSQTLWSFQAFSQLKEANFQAAAAEATFRGAQESLLLRIAQAYFGILSATDQLATNRSERAAFSSMLAQATIRQQTGVGPHSDVAQAQAFYDATEQSVIDAQSALDDASLALAVLVGARPERVAPLRDDIPLTSPQPTAAQEWVTSALQDNFDVRAAGLRAEAAARDIATQRGRGLPTLQLTGSSSKALQNDAFGGNQRLDTIGVAFSWPILQGGAVASAVRQSRALAQQADAQLEAVQRDTERQTRAAFRNIVSGVQRVAASRRAVSSGKDAVEASRRNVEFGTGTEFDLLNAQVNYFTAIRAYSQARYDYLTSVLTLKQQAGRLSELDLDAIDALLVENT